MFCDRRLPSTRDYIACIPFALAVVLGAVNADDRDVRTWVGYQNECMVAYPDSASWFDSDNWLGFLLPDSLDHVRFGWGDDPAGDGQPSYLLFGTSCVAIDSCTAEQMPGGEARCLELLMLDGHWVFDFSASGIGDCTPDTLHSGSFTAHQWLTLGSYVDLLGRPGEATLEIRKGTFRTYSTGHSGHIASRNMDSVGELIIDGPDAAWEFTAGMQIGHEGHGIVSVLNGGSVIGEWAGVGNHVGSQATITVDGAGSTLDFSSNMWIGASGSAVVHVINGGDFHITGISTLGSDLVGHGEIRVSGTGSSATWDGPIEVGQNGTGAVLVSDGGDLECNHLNLGRFSTASGTVSIDGDGSRLEVYNTLTVGDESSGGITIDDGGRLDSGFSTIAWQPGSVGTLVARNGSAWSSYGTVWVGWFGQGSVAVESGSEIGITLDLVVGSNEEASGEVSVIDVGSMIQCDRLLLGYGGDGSLTLSEGGSANVRSVTIGDQASSTGILTVSGSSSNCAATEDVSVGSVSGEGILVLENDGTCAASVVNVGANGQLIGDGSVLVATSVSNHGSVAPGSPVGRLQIDGDYSQGAVGALRVDLAGVSAETGYDVLEVVGTATLAGSLLVSVDSNYSPSFPSSYEIVTATTVSGQFTTVVIEGYEGYLSYSDSTVTVWIGSPGFNRVTTDPAADRHPTWSPDGSQLAFVSDRSGNLDIWTIPAIGGPAAQLTSDPAADSRPRWSPDGTTLAFESDRDGDVDIWLIPADGGSATQLTTGGGRETSPCWSPDGDRVAFGADWSGNEDIWIIDADGGGAAQLTDDPADDIDPAWSPDGATIVFQSERSGNWDVWSKAVEEGTDTQLTTDPATDAVPDWSPFGTEIAFASARSGNEDIWSLSTVGDPPAQLTIHPLVDGGPEWSPDGSRVAFHSDRVGNFDIWIHEVDWPPTIERVRESNISSASATVSWTTRVSVDGSIHYGLTSALGESVSDPLGEGLLHYVEIEGLLPDTTYYYELVSAKEVDDNDGSYYALDTSSIGAGTPYSIYGELDPAADWTILYASVRSEGGSVSLPLSAVVDSSGVWWMNLGNLKDSATLAPFVYAAGDTILFEGVESPITAWTYHAFISGQSPQDCGPLPPTTSVAPPISQDLQGRFPIRVSPNPVSRSAVIRYMLPSDRRVTLGVYDATGRHVATLVDGDRRAGTQNLHWEPGAIMSGVYFLRLRAGDLEETTRMLILR